MTELAVVDDHLHHQDQREGLELGRPVGAGVLGSAGALGVAIALDRLFHGADRGLWRLAPALPATKSETMTELAVVDDHTFTIKTGEKVSGSPARRCRGPRQCRCTGCRRLFHGALDRLFHGADRGLR